MSYKTRERFASLHLAVHRMDSGAISWTLILKQADGSRKWDRRLGWGQLEYSPGAQQSTDPIAALQAALEAASRARAGDGSTGSPIAGQTELGPG